MATMRQRARAGRIAARPVEGTLDSSFLVDYKYYRVTQVLVLRIRNSRGGINSYTYRDVSERTFNRFRAAKAVCVTKDTEESHPRHPRWEIGDQSHGAFYNQFIKLGGIRSRFVRAARARLTRFGGRFT